MSEYGDEEIQDDNEEIEEEQELDENISNNQEINIEDFEPINEQDIELDGETFEPSYSIKTDIHDYQFEIPNNVTFKNTYEEFEPTYSEKLTFECRIGPEPPRPGFIGAIIDDPTLSTAEKIEMLKEKQSKLWDNSELSIIERDRISKAIDDAISEVKGKQGGYLDSSISPNRDTAGKHETSNLKDNQNITRNEITNQEKVQSEQSKKQDLARINDKEKELELKEKREKDNYELSNDFKPENEPGYINETSTDRFEPHDEDKSIDDPSDVDFIPKDEISRRDNKKINKLNNLKDFEEKIDRKSSFIEGIEYNLDSKDIDKEFTDRINEKINEEGVDEDFPLENRKDLSDKILKPEERKRNQVDVLSLIKSDKKSKYDKDDIENLIKSLKSKEIPSSSEIAQKKLIANQQKFGRLKKVVIEQMREFGITKQKKYRISEIINKIGYKYNNMRVRNTIKDLIGEKLFPIFFGGEFGQKAKYNLEDVFQLAERIGRDRYGTPGIVTSRGVELFLKDTNSGISPSKARTEIWCQQKNHPPFTPLIYKLSLERSWCRQCLADVRMKSYDEVLMIGAENGYILDETAESFVKKMKDRGNKNPKDVRLNWICKRCDTPKNYSYHNIQKTSKSEASGCKTCFSKSLEITKDYVQKVAKEKGIKLDMTDEEFEAAKEKMKKQNRAPSRARLIWKIHGKQVPLSFNYVAYLMNNKARYKNIDYISPTGHRSSEGENHGRWVLQKMFGAKFEHAFFKDIVGEELELSGNKVKIHPRSHVDGYDIVHVKGKDFKTVYEFWEMYHHKKPDSKKKDEFKRTACNTKEIILIVLTDEQNPVNFQQIIARQFTKQTGIKIQHQYQKKLDSFLKTNSIKGF